MPQIECKCGELIHDVWYFEHGIMLNIEANCHECQEAYFIKDILTPRTFEEAQQELINYINSLK